MYRYEFNNLQLPILLKHWVILHYIIHLLHAHIYFNKLLSVI